MATIFTREWGGTNGQAWTTVDFEALIVAGTEALIQSSQGWGPAAGGTERIYRATAFPQVTGYEVDLDGTWDDAAGSGRWVGIALRVTSDGACYSVELDSNVGTTRCRIRRRSPGGSWTVVSAYDSPAGIPASAALNSGVTLTGRVENTDEDEVTVKLLYGATELASYTDTSASRIESGGSAGVVLDANWVDDDIIVDNLIVRDFEDEWAGAGDLDVGVALIVDGTYYSWEDLQAAGITVGVPKQAYTLQPVCELTDTLKLGEASTILYPGAVVTVSLDGNVVAFGRLRTASESWDTKEGRRYELAGSKQLATDVLVIDPEWQTDLIRFNVPTDAEDYHPDRADLEIGEAVAYLIDNNLEGDGKLRDQLAAPPDGVAYTQADLDAMDAELPELEVRGDVVAAVESLLSFTKYALFINPDTRKWEFHERNAGTIQTIDVGTTFAQGETSITPERNATAVSIVGARPETTLTTLANGSGLNDGWPAGLEATHSWEKQHKNHDTGAVDVIGTAGGKVTMTPVAPFSMVADEWLACRVKFTSGGESGETYDVNDNTGSTFTFEETAWKSGGPSAADTFEVYGNKEGGGKDNGYTQIGRRFTLNNANLGIPSDACGFVKVIANGIAKKVKFTHNTPTDASEPAEIELDMPANALINVADPSTPADSCTDGAAVTPATVEVEIPTYDRTDPSVPRYRYPTSGFYGDAYTVDSAKWSGGGKAGRGDPAVMREHVLAIPAYDGSAAHDTEMAKLAQDVLAILSPLSREVRITIAGFDFNFLNLDCRLQITRTGGSTGIWSSLTNLGVVGVEYDPVRKTTTVHAGTQASGDYDIEGMRRDFLARSRVGHDKDALQKVRELLECLNGTPKGSGEVGQIAPAQICAQQIVVPPLGGGSATPLDEVVSNTEECAVGDPPATTPCTTECLTPAPITNVSQAGTNATNVQGSGGGSGKGGIIQESRPPGGDADAGAGKNNTAEAICCILEHIQGLWLSDEVIASGLNDVAAIVSTQFVLLCNAINANRAAILQINYCILNNVQAYTSLHPTCTLTDPDAITACDACGDYCTTSIPTISCGIETPP